MAYRVFQGFKSYVAVDLDDLKQRIAKGEIKPEGFVQCEDGSRSQLAKMPDLKEAIAQGQALRSSKAEERLKTPGGKAEVYLGVGLILLLFYGLLRPPTEAERAEQGRAESKASAECRQKVVEKYGDDARVSYGMINDAGKCK
jgi:hypothetical protein